MHTQVRFSKLWMLFCAKPFHLAYDRIWRNLAAPIFSVVLARPKQLIAF